MSHGGARNRSGPQHDPASLRTAERGIALTALPSGGYTGKAPDLKKFLLTVTPRHRAIWAELWTTPQACAWAAEPWRWPIVADMVEFRVRVDDPDSPAALITSIRQLRDDLGLSAAGLKANGWAIARDEVAAKRAGKPATKASSARDRMRVVSSVDGA